MHTNIEELIRYLSASQVVTLDGSPSSHWSLGLAYAAQCEPSEQLVHFVWSSKEGVPHAHSLTREGIENGSFCPGSRFICEDSEGDGVLLHFVLNPYDQSNGRTLNDLLAQDPFYRDQAFPPGMLAQTEHSPLGKRLMTILDPSRLQAFLPEEAYNQSLIALQSAAQLFYRHTSGTKKVQITLVARTLREHTETLEVPADMTDEELDQLVTQRYNTVDAGLYVDDPDYWERSISTRHEPAGDWDHSAGSVTRCDNGAFIVQTH